jgi:outer membrane protein
MRFKQQISACFRLLAVVLAIGCVFATGRRVSASEQGPSSSLRVGQAAQQPPAPVTPAPQESVGPTLAVTVDEAVRLALQNNLGLEAERLGPQAAAFDVAEARAAYAPNLFSITTKSSSASPPSDFLTGTGAVITSGGVRTTNGLAQAVPWGGGRYQVSFFGARSTTTGFTNYNPALRSTLDASYTQPLLRGFKIDGLRNQLRLTRNAEQIADLDLRQRVTQVSRLARTGYYNLVSTISALDIARQSLELSRELLRNNERKVEVGTMAPIDITEAQAEVARLEENVFVAESQIRSAEDSLRMLLLNPSRPDFWTTKLVPAEQPTLEPKPIDVDAAITNALQNRVDIAVVKKRLESTDISMEFLRNQKLPEVNLQANYGVIGLAGTQFQFGEGGFPPPVVSQTQRSFMDAVRDVLGNDFRSWSFQVNVSYPIGTSTADAALASARLRRQQQQTNLRELEMAVTAQVRNAGRQVTTSLQRVQSTRTARVLSEKRLAAEEKRLEVGLSDTFRVSQTQRDLSAAKRAELQAILDYNNALVNFEAVQTVPLGGGQ